MNTAPPGPDCQRIDKWLWFARLVKTRGLAQRLVAAGNVRVNHARLMKPSQTVTPGDVISILVHDYVRVLRVEQAGTRRGPATEAQLLYTDMKVDAQASAEQGGNDPA